MSTAPRILIIDDHPATIELTGFMLSKVSALEGFQTIVNYARNLREGIAVALAFRPDLIICDLRMPDNGGLEFGKEARTHQKLMDVPMLLLTEQDISDELMAAAKAVGYANCIRKPVDEFQFAHELTGYIKR